jgi:plastocyanin
MPTIGKSLRAAAFFAVAFITAAGPRPGHAQVSGRIQVTDVGGRMADDLGNAVVFIEGRGPRGGAATRTEMALDARQFRPRVIVVPVGTTVTFPNLDPFNHNVFSLSGANAFDLGLYGRDETESRRFTRSGVVKIYCNVHPRMTGVIVVRDNAWYAQPSADGSFSIGDVPPGTYTLVIWHERANAVRQQITVPAGGLANLEVQLDASSYVFQQHRNKNGQDYGSGTTRERY